ncbi:MAG: GNAT family N-acetyltransferase [Anaerolineaceae bacterium]
MTPEIPNLRLETERLLIREMHLEDADFHFNKWSDPEVSRFMCDEYPLQKREQAEDFLRQFQLRKKNPHLNWWSIESKADGLHDFRDESDMFYRIERSSLLQ